MRKCITTQISNKKACKSIVRRKVANFQSSKFGIEMQNSQCERRTIQHYAKSNQKPRYKHPTVSLNNLKKIRDIIALK